MYAEVSVNIPYKKLNRTFSYAVPEGMPARRGVRVIVPFGKGDKLVEGFVTRLTPDEPQNVDKIKFIAQICGEEVAFDAHMLELARWMSDKYFTSLSECLKCVIPSGVRLKSPRRAPVRPPSVFTSPKPVLTNEQEAALARILQVADNPQKPVLLHGVTGSGKTEVYLRVIEHVLSMGKQAIALVPEISLTPQTLGMFIARFGELVCVTHSKLSKSEKLIQWKKARDGEAAVMVGPRSAVFAPFTNLGVIIIDEEHEHTYKSETAPKYSAFEMGKKRCEMSGALLLLGSATPSLSAFYAVGTGDMELCAINHRVNLKPPQVDIIDMRRELAFGNRSIFSQALREALERNIKSGKQSILFLNRRGHSTFVSCRRCGHVLGCGQCSVNYTYHQIDDTLVCHYCGKTIRQPEVCPVCGSKFLRLFGLGTEKVEEETRRLFPDAKIVRMDMDTTKGKYGHEDMLNSFRDSGDILIGTQMIAKGLDFPNVTVVGVVAADLSLNNGDYRAGETTFQLLTQVAGRAGRAEFPGQVFIQTYMPEHYAVIFAAKQNYRGFYEHEISLRRQMNYPPFVHVFSVMFTGEDETAIKLLLLKLKNIMNAFNRHNRFEMLGPAPAQIVRIKNRYRWKILIKCVDEDKLKNFALYCLERLREREDLSHFAIGLTADPMVIE
ncbi:MAG: primosomal protein N' [Clostridiales bacterium]|nr:primosomal protein N' [Clostridiales bacterium]